MEIVVLAGGIGGGKFLRGVVRAAGDERITAIVNTGDDITMHGLRVCPDLDSVTYWLADLADRDRGWGRRGETFRATEELARLAPDAAWFSLGDLDLALHLFRTRLLQAGRTLTEASAVIAERYGVTARILPVTDDALTTMISVAPGRDASEGDGGAAAREIHFQEYWVRDHGQDPVRGIRFDGAAAAVAAPGVLEAITGADAVLLAPSNPVVSIGPILAVAGVRDALSRARASGRVAGVSGIVGGAPVSGMADRLMPAAGLAVSAAGAADAYTGLLNGWVIDEVDRELARGIEATGVRVAVTDTIMRDDETAEAVALVALGLIDGSTAG
jgi:LPPG:FO 2-phospho-L-lactate transferase